MIQSQTTTKAAKPFQFYDHVERTIGPQLNRVLVNYLAKNPGTKLTKVLGDYRKTGYKLAVVAEPPRMPSAASDGPILHCEGMVLVLDYQAGRAEDPIIVRAHGQNHSFRRGL